MNHELSSSHGDIFSKFKQYTAFTAHVSSWIVLIAPFFWYGQLIFGKLKPLPLPDTFAYLWPQPINWFYFSGRSLTQRIIFSLLGNQLNLIVGFQFCFYLFTAVCIYLLLRKPEQPYANFARASSIAFFFSSYTFNVIADLIISEPIFLALSLLFPCILFLAQGKYRIPIILGVGILFIFSKNTAPYTIILLLGLHWLTTRRARNRSMLGIYAVFIFFALTSIFITMRYDTSTQINTVNNLYKQVFIDPEMTLYFQQHYGMPDGPFIDACRDSWIGDPCFGFSLITINLTTRNYELVPDSYGFVPWIQQRGQRDYLKHLLWDNSFSTYQKFRQIYTEMMRSRAFIVLNDYLGVDRPANVPNNLAVLAAGDAGRMIGFFGVDPFLLTRDLLLSIKFDHLELIFCAMLIGIVLSQRYPDSRYLPLATGMLGIGVVLIFLGFFGDSMEETRHVLPGLIVVTLGSLVYLLSLVTMGYSIVRQWQANRSAGDQSRSR